ncbi:RNA-directed DNA polymerase (Reverse transcriptase) [Trifolium medium]|uniref:RNA-directed DNA polymerase (Reverse transcriptase) n=1 Tax=Trifolium medium TaxID=97028 RepID=A0A392P091_9FABA|nr:RNA-directed DNA polymerase (Reverse transcriptase) [Trifolium medium]
MRACIFESFMSVLVNGSPTEDFKVYKGPRQGDPLSPFLFLIVAEGLAGIPVGANPRRAETWRPVVEAMSKRLSSWSSRHLSYGGRITLIN